MKQKYDISNTYMLTLLGIA